MLAMMTILSALSDLPLPARVDARSLPNLIQVTDQVYSGGLPDGPAGFEELRRLGIKTVISVDGAKPDVGSAEKAGLRYVHLPHGYDTVPARRAHELARGLRDLPSPIYIHCHHGKHRSPAAAAVACVEANLIDKSQAKALLQLAGTGRNYRGLHTAVDRAQPIDQAILDQADRSFPSVAPIPPLAERMVEMDELLERITRLQRTGFANSADLTDDPTHLTLLLHEAYIETARLDEISGNPQVFHELLASGAEQSRLLHEDFDEGRHENALKRLDALKQNCSTCHEQFRDNAGP